jgi:hypothetical protein|nr:MAG TPA: hypothetical protein [Caudoviricetes sp.]
MANEQNLIPASQRSKSEARENSKKGGVASGKARRRKKALRLALKGLMDIPLGELAPDLRDGIMIAAKLTDEGLTVADAVIGSIVRTACNGNSQMAKLLLDTIGESMEARMREREVKLKEKSLDEGRIDNVAPITFVFEREETE